MSEEKLEKQCVCEFWTAAVKGRIYMGSPNMEGTAVTFVCPVHGKITVDGRYVASPGCHQCHTEKKRMRPHLERPGPTRSIIG